MSSSRLLCFFSLCVLSASLVGCGSGSNPSPAPASPPPSPSTATPSFQLTVTSPPAGQGTVTSTPAGIKCPGTCAASFSENTRVTLTATPDANYLFGNWSGACSGQTCTVTIKAATTIAASFIAEEGVNVSINGGGGSVTSNPPGINCPAKSCSAVFPDNTQVTLTETPGTSSYFNGWTGCSGTTTCSLTVTAAENVIATFTGPEALTVTTTGTGSGAVTSSPPGINCPTQSCSANFPPKTQVTLTETPGTNYYFGGWTGCSGTTTCTVTMTAPESVSATFTVGDTLTVTTAGTGTGTVSSSPAGINCTSGSTTGCSTIFPPNTPVTLTETTNVPNQFDGWTGVCTGSGTTCSVTLNAATNAEQATFIPGGTLQSLNHIIVMAQENRSFDHYFGYMRQYWANNGIPDQSFDGLPQFNPPSGIPPLQGPPPSLTGCNPNDNGDRCVPDTGVTVTSFHMPSVCTEELSPFWNESHRDWDYLDPENPTPELNGFVISGADDARQYKLGHVNDVDGLRTMGYFQDSDLNYYYFMASDFATSDRWFSPIMSRTQLNRAYMFAATSQGYVYPPGANRFDANPFSATTIFQALQNAGITWRVYVEQDTVSPLYGNCSNDTGSLLNQCLADASYINMFTWETQVLSTPSLYVNFVPQTQFQTDAQSGNLPQFAFIEPPSDVGLDEHPSDSDNFPEDIQAGENYVAGLINTLMTSQSWKDSAFIFTYDEGGGFYDHVPPQPAVVADQYAYPVDLVPGDFCYGVDATSGVCSLGMTGFRVPFMVVSPFSKKNYVSHTVYDSTAILALVEKRFGIPALTARDAAQADMSADFFDFVNAPWLTPPTPPTVYQGGDCSVEPPKQ